MKTHYFDHYHMNRLFFSILIIINFSIFLGSCDKKSEKGKSDKNKIAYEYYESGKIKSEAETKDGKAHGLMKNYTAGGLLESVYTYENGTMNGPAVTYYPNGQAREKKYYKAGRKQGMTRMYYRSGELYREATYENGKIEGIRMTYYKDGSVMAEAPYKNGFPGLGLKEYSLSGNLLNDKPAISIEAVNNLLIENKYILNLRLVPTKPGTIFYIGDLEDGKFIHEGLWPIQPINNVAKYTLQVNKGGFRMETLTISAQYRTDKSNYGVVSKKYNLAIDNK